MRRAERVRDDPDPALGWCLGNVVGRPDRRGDLYPAKQRRERKIDVTVALMMAVGRAMAEDAGEGNLEDLRRIMLDVDDPFDAVHGRHQLRLSDVHEHGFQPIAMFDGKRRPVTAGQRVADRLSAADLPLVT